MDLNDLGGDDAANALENWERSDTFAFRYEDLFMRTRLRTVTLGAVVVLLLLGCFIVPANLNRDKPVASVLLTNGCLVKVERVSYGIHHAVGVRFRYLALLAPTIPERVRQFLWPHPGEEMTLDRPGLALWLTATDGKTGKSADIHHLLCHFVDSEGNAYANEGGVCSTGGGFFRSSYRFPSYPRTERQLTLCIRDEDDREYRVTFPNPHVTRPVVRPGRPLPQSQPIGEMEIRLLGLAQVTNPPGRVPLRTWEPKCELLSNGRSVTGWEAPQWNFEDQAGNRTHFLDAHQRVFRVEVVFYPSATNQLAATVLTNFARLRVLELRTNLLWNTTLSTKRSLAVLGLFTPGPHMFSNGVYQTAAPAWWTPQTRGSPMEFSTSRGWSLAKDEFWLEHTTDGPAVYVRGPWSEKGTRLGVRIIDSHGRIWPARQIGLMTDMRAKDRESLTAFLLDVPPEAGEVDVEIVTLKPVSAVFDVDTTAGARRNG